MDISQLFCCSITEPNICERSHNLFYCRTFRSQGNFKRSDTVIKRNFRLAVGFNTVHEGFKLIYERIVSCKILEFCCFNVVFYAKCNCICYDVGNYFTLAAYDFYKSVRRILIKISVK